VTSRIAEEISNVRKPVPAWSILPPPTLRAHAARRRASAAEHYIVAALTDIDVFGQYRRVQRRKIRPKIVPRGSSNTGSEAQMIVRVLLTRKRIKNDIKK
jgi:hypothetical protein